MSWLRAHFNVLRAVLPSLVVLLLLTIVGVAIRNAQQATNAKLRTLVVQGCERLNVKQREDNRNQLADYRYESRVLKLVKLAPPRSVRQRGRLAEFIGPLEAAISAKAWVPVVADCSAVGPRYRLPHAIPFTVQLPPQSAIADS